MLAQWGWGCQEPLVLLATRPQPQHPAAQRGAKGRPMMVEQQDAQGGGPGRWKLLTEGGARPRNSSGMLCRAGTAAGR